MKLYLISQEENNEYDTYDAAVVAAENEEAAKLIHPSPEFKDRSTWVSPKFVQVKYIGEAAEGTKAGVILSSFNAG